jgi:hypothetical protein
MTWSAAGLLSATDDATPELGRKPAGGQCLRDGAGAGHEAFEKAVQLARKLPEDLGPDGVTLSRTGEWVIGCSQPPAAP